MAFNSYLVQKFDQTHENEYFRKLSANLSKVFGEQHGSHVLIGNVNCQGNPLDAIFLSKGKILVIDLKNYGGALVFSENSPWKMISKDGSACFVSGGANGIRNPFNQVKKYRFALITLLAELENDILEKNHTNIDWGHVGGLILFHQPVVFNPNSLPQIIQKWFHIADSNTIVDKLNDINSDRLELNDDELMRIVNALGVGSEHELRSYDWDEDAVESSMAPTSESKIALVKKLLDGSATESLYKRAISFYQAMVNVERFKEPQASDLHVFPFDPTRDLGAYKLDLSSSEEFHSVYVQNLQQQFPKNMFIALLINMDGNSYPLLFDIKMASDITNLENIDVNFNSFGLYTRELEGMGLDADVTEELSTAINDADSLDSKINVLREYLGDSVSLTTRLQVGLSTESLFTAQVLSELRKLKKVPEDQIGNTVFRSFLFNESTRFNEPELTLDPYIEVTPLNEFQREAVQASFKLPISVITGPPGTGKSQVVMNIIANAITSGHSVVFASKNNKAIDCVKERLDALMDEEYVLRFGSKDNIESSSKPVINSFISRSEQNAFSNQEETRKNIIEEIKQSLQRVAYLESEIERIDTLKGELNAASNALQNTKDEHARWLRSVDDVQRKIFIDENDSVKLDVNEVNLLLQSLKSANSNFFTRLLFNLFQKSGATEKLKRVNDNQPTAIYDLVSSKAPWASDTKPILDSGIDNLTFLKELDTAGKEIASTSRKFQSKELDQGNAVDRLVEEIEELIERKPEYEKEIEKLKSERAKSGLKLLNLSVTERLRNQNKGSAKKYSSYIPPNNIWRDEEVKDYIQSTTEFLKDYKAVCMTSLSVKNSLPLAAGIIDLLVIDEASQCDIASALPLLFRAKRVVVIGDPLQLKHITSVQKPEQEYAIDTLAIQEIRPNYVENSLYDNAYSISLQSNLTSVFLGEHYRCHPEIISFCNTEFYERELGQTMKIRTKDEDFVFGDKGVRWIHVNGEMAKTANLNQAEVSKCIELTGLLAVQNPKASIGIITPFRDQKLALQKQLANKMPGVAVADTVHRFQGDEKDIIILSTVVTTDCQEGKTKFINRNAYLLNVAITRARSTLYVVGNHSYCASRKGRGAQPLASLAEYAEELNHLVI